MLIVNVSHKSLIVYRAGDKLCLKATVSFSLIKCSTSFKESIFRVCQIVSLNEALVCLMLVLLKGKGNSLNILRNGKKYIDRINFNFRKTVICYSSPGRMVWFGLGC